MSGMIGMPGELRVSVQQDPTRWEPEPLSEIEKELLAFRKYKLALRAESLALAGYDLKRLGICRCGERAEPRKNRCAECELAHNKKLNEKPNAKPV